MIFVGVFFECCFSDATIHSIPSLIDGKCAGCLIKFLKVVGFQCNTCVVSASERNPSQRRPE